MRLLLDTQAWLWMLDRPERLSSDARDLVRDGSHVLLLSSVSAAEIAIKHGIGKLGLPQPPERYVPSRMRRSDVQPLPLGHTHALRVAALPLHHRDPFDRLLIAQAQVEAIAVLTADAAFAAYDVEVVPAA